MDSRYLDRSHVTIGSTDIPVEVVTSTKAINRGLAHRRSLEASQGMLFLFDHSALFKFWMRGMRFPIDIIWINEERKIVDISENLPTLSFIQSLPFSPPRFYSPSVPAKYVLEVNAHFSKDHGIAIGDEVTFNSIQL